MTYIDAFRQRAAALIWKAGITLKPEEVNSMEILDFGLKEPEVTGAQIVHIVDTNRLAVRLIALLPNQTEPEHTHPLDASGGKEETIRCTQGTLFIYGPGSPTPNPSTTPPAHRASTYTVHHEYALKSGDHVTFSPGEAHWFKAGPEGAVCWSFSTRATDAKDRFTDPHIVR